MWDYSPRVNNPTALTIIPSNYGCVFMHDCLLQAKGYVKGDRNQVNFKSLEDISWLKEIIDDVNSPTQYYAFDYLSSSIVAALILCTFLWINVLILILTVLNIEKIYNWIEESRTSLKDLYKASASVLTFINLATFGGDLTAIFSDSQFSAESDDSTYEKVINDDFITYLTIKLLLVFLIIVVDLLVTCRNTLKRNQKRLYGVIHAVALCQIIWFMHRLATDAIISVIVFVIAPAQTLGAVTLLLSTIVCAILFVSSMLKKRCRCCSKEILPLFCTLLIAICTIGLIVTVTLLFIALVSHGLHSAGIGGFVLSLVPPTTIFVIGLCVNRKIVANFYHNVFASNSATGSAQNAEVSRPADAPTNVAINSQFNETTPLIQNVQVDR